MVIGWSKQKRKHHGCQKCTLYLPHFIKGNGKMCLETKDSSEQHLVMSPNNFIFFSAPKKAVCFSGDTPAITGFSSGYQSYSIPSISHGSL